MTTPIRHTTGREMIEVIRGRAPNLRILIIPAGMLLAYVGGQHATDPRLPLLITVTVAALVVLILSHAISRYFLVSLGLLLVGYAFFDRGFAYIGLPPLYVGEAVLLLAVSAIILGTKRRRRIDLILLVIAAFILLGLARALPYWPMYGLDVARDSVTWTYAIFAIAITLVFTRQNVVRVTIWYDRLLVPFLIVAPAMVVFSRTSIAQSVTWPISNGPMLSYKGGDLAVHAAGAAAFILLGLWQTRSPLRETMVWALWLVSLAISMTGRSAMLTITASLAVCWLLVQLLPRNSQNESSVTRRFTPLVVTGALLLAFLLVVSPNITLGTRTLSLEQAFNNARSIVISEAGEDEQGLQGTKNWRTRWWTDIVDYTFHGPYFWTGKGYGINLANEDGFQPTADRSLRAPHSAHFTILARMGVPGFLVWIVLQVAFVGGLFRAFTHARRRNDLFRARLDAWVIVYWTAFMVNASFDVYLEGPQGGIWFWSLFGFGWAVLRLQSESKHAAPPSSPPDTGWSSHARPANS